jgi:hypothetical protein
MAKDKQRLRRQFDALARGVPVARRPIERLLDDRMRLVRLPVGVLLIGGGFISFLPIFGLWMLPLGLMLLAVDIPALRPAVSAAMIRLRRLWRRNRAPADGD